MSSSTPRRRPGAAGLVGLALIMLCTPWTQTRVWVSAQSQSLFVSVTDADGEPVTDLTRQDLVVEYDGEILETLDFESIDWPVRVTVFVDNGVATAPLLDHMREGVRLFVDALPSDVDVAIATIGGRPQFWTEHTSDRQQLEDAVGLIAPEMDGAAKFFDALYEEAERLAEDTEGEYFPVIVMVATNGPEESSRVRDTYFREMMERLFARKATLHTRMFNHTSVSGVKQGGYQMQWAIDIGGALGGSYEGLSSPNGFRSLLPQLAEEIGRKHRLVSRQYRLTYEPPQNASDQPSIRVLTTRPGVALAPTLDGNLR